MNSIVNEFIYSKIKKIKNPPQELNHVPTIISHFATPPSTCRTHMFFTIFILFLCMILMSEKMTSLTITDEFIYISV